MAIFFLTYFSTWCVIIYVCLRARCAPRQWRKPTIPGKWSERDRIILSFCAHETTSSCVFIPVLIVNKCQIMSLLWWSIPFKINFFFFRQGITFITFVTFLQPQWKSKWFICRLCKRKKVNVGLASASDSSSDVSLTSPIISLSSRCCSPVPARLSWPLSWPLRSLYLRFPSDQETSQWINIKILFRGIRLGNILPSNAALARARAGQGINY